MRVRVKIRIRFRARLGFGNLLRQIFSGLSHFTTFFGNG
jgi:hypothetical protein